MEATGQILQISKFPDTLSFVIILGMFWRNLTKIGQINKPLRFAQGRRIPPKWRDFKLKKARKQLAPRQEAISPPETANQWDNGTSWCQ